jgi:hypothetical protein
MSNVRVWNDNFIDTDVVFNSFFSSEQTAFPTLNIYNKQRRSKVWRSNGYWKIPDAANSIVFRETTGVDLTATLASTEFTSGTSFRAAIKAALELVGASTYTVSLDVSTQKIKIASDGSGGSGIFELRWVSAPLMADILGFDETVNLSGALNYVADDLRIHTSEWFVWDMGISSNPKALAIIGPRNLPIKISPSAIITLQGNETNVWTSPSYEQELTYNDEVILLTSDAGLHTEALRYWRLEIVDRDNPNYFIEIGSIYLGNFYTPTRGAVQFPLSSAPVDRSTTIFSESGQTFSDIREKAQTFDLDWSALTSPEMEELLEVFDDFGTSLPFFIQLDPIGVFSSSENYYTRYVKFESEPRYRLTSPNFFETSWNLREEL